MMSTERGHKKIIKMGKWLKKRRESAGISRGTLATRVGATYDTIRLYEEGKQVMRLDRFFDLLDALNINSDEFFPESEN